jgi:hypothetical protein
MPRRLVKTDDVLSNISIGVISVIVAVIARTALAVCDTIGDVDGNKS